MARVLMRAYQEMLYGNVSTDQAARREYEKAPLRYCRVDTHSKEVPCQSIRIIGSLALICLPVSP